MHINTYTISYLQPHNTTHLDIIMYTTTSMFKHVCIDTYTTTSKQQHLYTNICQRIHNNTYNTARIHHYAYNNICTTTVSDNVYETT